MSVPIEKQLADANAKISALLTALTEQGRLLDHYKRVGEQRLTGANELLRRSRVGELLLHRALDCLPGSIIKNDIEMHLVSIEGPQQGVEQHNMHALSALSEMIDLEQAECMRHPQNQQKPE